MKRRPIRQVGLTVTLLIAFACQGTWALASTTGGLAGYVLDADTSAPIAGATVTASAPSQSATATTDAAGHFTFLTLGPDTYTVSASKSGYQTASAPGQIVFADTVQTVSVRLTPALKTIAHVTAAGAGALVKSGTTADIYSVNATTQQSVAALGGGGSLNQAYSAIATMPGAYVVPNQTGYFETVNIRGGDYDQVGYEFDGVPVLRSFDNYGSSSANSLGNAEVQVYTGATPANSESAGLSGFINQVIKTGTYPGYAQGSLGIGTPFFYHRAAVEAGGATPDRLFSYYVGIGGSPTSFNYVDSNNGSQYQNFFGPGMGAGPNGAYAKLCLLGSVACFPGGFQVAQGPVQYASFSTIFSRDAVANFHIGIPHRFDSGRDDIQVLYDNESLENQLYQSANDFASPQCTGSAGVSGLTCATHLYGPQLFANSLTWSCPSSIGGTFSGAGLNAISRCVSSYGYPNAVNPGSFTHPNALPAGDRGDTYNETVIGKLQYTKNFGSSAFLRVYGYTFYSAWSLANTYAGNDCLWTCAGAPDYELSTHTRGVSANFQDQLNEQNLVSLQGSYTTASVTRMNNHFGSVPGEAAAVIVNPRDPYSGYCYGTIPGTTTFGVVDCAGTLGSATTYGAATFPEIMAGAVPNLPSSLSCAIPGKPQLGSACSYMVAENGSNAEITPGLVPNFYGWSLTDQFRPNDKWLFNIGGRLDTFNFAGGDQVVPPVGGGGPQARAFWWNAFNLDNCQRVKTGAIFTNPAPGKVCPAGSISTYLENQTNQNFTYNVWQPRFAGTFTVNPNNVIRFSAGRYTEAANTAFEQYGTWQEDSADFIGPTFLQYGRNTPGYPVLPQTSDNYDISWETHLKGTDWSFKVTPFLRQTQEQLQEFFLNAKEGFVSALNAGDQRSQGVELQVQKGDFSRNGISGLLSFAYTNAYIKYGTVNPYGATVLTSVNTQIQQYNAYTAACVRNPANPNCGAPSNGMTANACYNSTGAPVAPTSIAGTTIRCPAGDIVNPYWFAPVQSLLSANQNYWPYDIFPGSTSFPGAYGSYNAPYVASLVLNYKHDKFAITPSFQFEGGEKYGYPLSSVGIDPAAGGCTPLAGYPGQRANSTSCNSVVNIPNPYTGTFDDLNSFTQPNEFMMNMQLSYEVSPKIQVVGTVANIVNYCFAPQTEPWTFNDGNICQYGPPMITGGFDPVAPYTAAGSTANPPGHPGSIVSPGLKYPYAPNPGPFLASAANTSFKLPLQFYLTANIRL
ncbi:MAG: TonB-dependent receptor [Candidatus Eremiobacteraeota bacterium]|nr:TonB-dependent receptor [Candidatus Eremiobacteraeota bacterium]